eukprot:13846103-Ditylum_brightwellii.AAC.1
MKFYWAHGQCTQNHFAIYWCPGLENLDNCHTKHHSTVHHEQMQQYYLHTVEILAQYVMCTSPSDLQGCVELGRGHTQGLTTQRKSQCHIPLACR